MLQTDPALGGVAAVIFDEFHERSLNADVGLAFALDAQRHVAPALRVLAMSATLDGAAVARLLGGAPVIEHAARAHPVETHYVGKGLPALPGPRGHGDESPDAVVARVVRRALAKPPAICSCSCRARARSGACRRDSAKRALARTSTCCRSTASCPQPSRTRRSSLRAAGRRKVVLATNIAETSLTIDGVRVVVDSGLERRSVFDPGTGMSRLETQRISRASAEQRAGRAGRTAPGVCYRIWGESAQRTLAAHAPPEIATPISRRSRSSSRSGARTRPQLALARRAAGRDACGARDLLRRLDALDDAGRATAHGRALHALGLHPRLAQMLLAARDLGAPRAARRARGAAVGARRAARRRRRA